MLERERERERERGRGREREREREGGREWGAESNGKLPHLFIPSKTATWFPEFAVKDLPLGRTRMIYIYVGPGSSPGPGQNFSLSI